MHVFEMVVLVVAISVLGGIIMKYFERRHPQLSDDLLDKIKKSFEFDLDYCTQKDLSVFLDKFQTMEDRIQVLERIATDKGSSLASEIDNLK
ncbi:MAG: hypothetical protein JKY45_02770 [Emcibacter sp.]|nr:hypothetical protein [Emcibacter sp.]